jgi:hypothetical protein
MKNLTIARALLPLLLTGPLAAGQGATRTAAASTGDGRAFDRVIAARSKYVLADASREANDVTLAQIPSREPGPIFPRRPSYPPPAYSNLWASGGIGHPVAGGIIGFCLGAIVAAGANADKGGRVAAAFGGAAVGALLGIALGHIRRPYRGSSWPDPDEAAETPHPHRSPRATSSVSPAPPNLLASAATQLPPSTQAP